MWKVLRSVNCVILFLGVIGFGKIAMCNETKEVSTLKIYERGKTFVFKCSFYSSDGSLIEKEEVSLIVLGGEKAGTNDQFEGRWKYESYPELDSTLTIGITEKEGFIFLHQPRHGKYIFTEICNFPSVRLPLYTNLKSKGRTVIPKESPVYGDYQGWKVRVKTKVTTEEVINDSPLGKGLKTWRIESVSRHKKGRNYSVFNFHESFGFLRMKFIHFDKNYLVMDLINVIE